MFAQSLRYYKLQFDDSSFEDPLTLFTRKLGVLPDKDGINILNNRRLAAKAIQNFLLGEKLGQIFVKLMEPK